MNSFAIQVYGKWILTGEHAVLRNCPALVFPVFGRSLGLHYAQEEARADLAVEFSGPHGDELRLLFWGVMEKALQLTGRERGDVGGRVHLQSAIPIGAGLGASAALCVAVGRWFAWRGWVKESALAEFCRQLENLFHGESSGVDIAVALSSQGLLFERSGPSEAFQPSWNPDWYLSYSGTRGVTSECVSKVKGLWARDERLGMRIDRDMREATEMAKKALVANPSDEPFQQLAEAIHKARGCFEHWGLAAGEIGHHMQTLLNMGAYAVKPTGSGNGGYVLSLWRTPPPEGLREQLISLRPQ